MEHGFRCGYTVGYYPAAFQHISFFNFYCSADKSGNRTSIIFLKSINNLKANAVLPFLKEHKSFSKNINKLLTCRYCKLVKELMAGEHILEFE